ncbi:ABC transporter ATP-binding protein (plasmid) [Azospirillum brasilense]|uniref:ABC transporter ATP-binding protein n=1 Tax=Azospirillum brasilense TaxID=192 RepID=A0A4D8RAF4_AZOBR|nr:ABC transporter ATP-binding protein [Azospirillum brasilense]QCO19938.1 ABC transporter ATP-binding protein [Azospirillum brasilense]
MSGELHVHNLGKAYRQYGSELRRILSWFSVPVRPRAEHWALRGVSFSVGRGEAVGIIGQNGAGKSTLLKLITGTIRPTEGGIHSQGRVAAILELGMGFNPDLTGRQNVYHAAGLVGFSHGDIDGMIGEIEDFAEIGDYFDQPTRTYSSGMQMRVAFAVATAVRPDLLIVDEALSVGDAYFQHKSFDRIRAFQKQGTSLLLVSHDKEAVRSICDRAILLEKGRMLRDGTPEEISDLYNALIAERESGTVTQQAAEDGRVRTVSGTGEATVEDIALLDAEGNPVDIVNVGATVTLRVRVRIHAPIPRLVLGYMIKDRLGQVMFGTNTHLQDMPLADMTPGECAEYSFTFPLNFGVGSYSVSTALVSTDTHLVNNYEWKDLALIFNVSNLNRRHFAGCNWMEPEIGIRRL